MTRRGIVLAGTVGASGSPAGAARSPSRVRRHAAAAAKVLFWGALAALCLAGLSISRLQCGGDMRGCFRHSKPLSGDLLESALPPYVHTSGAFALAGQASFSTTQVSTSFCLPASLPRMAGCLDAVPAVTGYYCISKGLACLDGPERPFLCFACKVRAGALLHHGASDKRCQRGSMVHVFHCKKTSV